mmetsp:Transcript_33576/g.54394  ORF Transcript_33576/g.54394 Transcript_33576/m.54394 type:complete len:279 (+) Transcript_33576:266-1102(+)|eukprot:CAMPEP_0184665896 /NCGR_PEP_ID=MMETSP0308-20130426/59222_1 /TAXON_ID=38269 /ORGANISM="Gloeochaete witrockiana, Strain SAG 46.84" /LENGTH=278 /DNA_ID=CAMNT_0027110175 /DNA_START=257 /DNA_END=1093 /DNA_ORIENTATION=-
MKAIAVFAFVALFAAAYAQFTSKNGVTIVTAIGANAWAGLAAKWINDTNIRTGPAPNLIAAYYPTTAGTAIAAVLDSTIPVGLSSRAIRKSDQTAVAYAGKPGIGQVNIGTTTTIIVKAVGSSIANFASVAAFKTYFTNNLNKFAIPVYTSGTTGRVFSALKLNDSIVPAGFVYTKEADVVAAITADKTKLGFLSLAKYASVKNQVVEVTVAGKSALNTGFFAESPLIAIFNDRANPAQIAFFRQLLATLTSIGSNLNQYGLATVVARPVFANVPVLP